MTEIVTTAASIFLHTAWNNGTSNFRDKMFQTGRSPLPIGGALPLSLPSWKMQDIIRLVILPLLFAVGAPLNLAALSHLMSEKKTVSSLAGRMHLLKLHLNISDLMILFVYTASQICCKSFSISYFFSNFNLIFFRVNHLRMARRRISLQIRQVLSYALVRHQFQCRCLYRFRPTSFSFRIETTPE